MTTRYPSSCLQAVSCLHRTQYAPTNTSLHITLLRRQQQPSYYRAYSFSKKSRRGAAKSPSLSTTPSAPTHVRPQQVSHNEAINPPASTLPPSLDIPARHHKGHEPFPFYLYRCGRAYGTFYKDGLKAVWANHRAASALKRRVVAELNARKPDLAPPATASKRWGAFRDEAVQRAAVTRADFQLLERNARDIGKLPFFALLVLLLGEWLPFVVPFIPNRVPGTCRIPKQVRGMREKSQDRRSRSFRSGVGEPEAGQVAVEGGRWRMTDKGYVREVLRNLRPEQLLHLSCVLNQHSRLWDRFQTSPPAALLRRSVGARVQYLALDDYLLVQAGGPGGLKGEELIIACEERGFDVLGKPEQKLRENLEAWIKKQAGDEGRGWAVVEMLFRR